MQKGQESGFLYLPSLNQNVMDGYPMNMSGLFLYHQESEISCLTGSQLKIIIQMHKKKMIDDFIYSFDNVNQIDAIFVTTFTSKGHIVLTNHSERIFHVIIIGKLIMIHVAVFVILTKLIFLQIVM